MKAYYLAIDIGASSGRHILGTVEDGKVVTEEVYRFPNGTIEKSGHLCWDVDALFWHILKGLKVCAAQGKVPVSVGIDTWGVDYVLLDGEGNLLGDAIAYRDARTAGMDNILEQRMPFEAVYARTGIAKQPFNTVYQLMAVKKEMPDLLMRAKCMLFMPCYLSYLLTGIMQNEYSIASTSGLLNARTHAWDNEVITAAGLPVGLFQMSPAMPGTVLGRLRPELVRQLGFDTDVILPLCHDTGSAFAAAGTADENTVYISSGTWSLLGTQCDTPITTAECMKAGFTNEGGYGGKIRLLQNITGMWILQQVRRSLNGQYTYGEMADLALQGTGYNGIFDPASDRFLSPVSMVDEIHAALAEAGFPPPDDTASLLCCIHRSLAQCYAGAIHELEVLTGRQFKAIRIFGGGCQNQVLNQWTEEAAAGIPVYAGPVEATAMGNILVQMGK